jgi:hypothetical protein
MSTASLSTERSQGRNSFGIIVLTGLLAGILDISAAMIKFYIDTGKGPAPIFKYIASGVFGKEAFSGGSNMISWGVVFHFCIAMTFTIVLFLVYPWLSKWIKNKFLIGILYGLIIWVIMNRIVVPLSGTPRPTKPFDVAQAAIQALILICMIGIPVSLIADWYYRRTRHVSPEF